jgi:hypothetical protein
MGSADLAVAAVVKGEPRLASVGVMAHVARADVRDRESRPEHPGWQVLLAVFSLTFVIYGLSPVRQNYDSYLAFPTAYSVVHDNDLYLDEFESPDGRKS